MKPFMVPMLICEVNMPTCKHCGKSFGNGEAEEAHAGECIYIEPTKQDYIDAEAVYKAIDYDDVDDFSGRVITIFDDSAKVVSRIKADAIKSERERLLTNNVIEYIKILEHAICVMVPEGTNISDVIRDPEKIITSDKRIFELQSLLGNANTLLSEVSGDRDRMKDAALAYQQLCVCYRVGKQPSYALFKRLDKARKTLEVTETKKIPINTRKPKNKP